MSPSQLTAILLCAAAGAGLGFGFAYLAAARVPEALVRVNVNGQRVPAILGAAVVPGGLGTLVALASIAAPHPSDSIRVAGATILIVVGLGAAGLWDDLRGDERPRGFKGHLGALRTGRMTGGLVKLAVGGGVGVAAGLLVSEGWGVARTGLLVALAANLINLLDRAPGRSGKVALVAGIALVALGDPVWAVIAAGFLGALVVTLPLDLREQAMLGDAGANPIGGLLGLGLALSLAPVAQCVVIGALVLLNAASERYSFSSIIGNNRLLHRLDMLGRSSRG